MTNSVQLSRLYSKTVIFLPPLRQPIAASRTSLSSPERHSRRLNYSSVFPKLTSLQDNARRVLEVKRLAAAQSRQRFSNNRDSLAKLHTYTRMQEHAFV